MSYYDIFNQADSFEYVNQGGEDIPPYSPIRILPDVYFDQSYNEPSEDVRPVAPYLYAARPDDVFSPFYAVNGGHTVPQGETGSLTVECFTPILINIGEMEVPEDYGVSFGVQKDSFDMSTDRDGFIFLGSFEDTESPSIVLAMQVVQSYTLGVMTEYNTGKRGVRTAEAYTLDKIATEQFGSTYERVPYGHRKGLNESDDMTLALHGSECFFLWEHSYDRDEDDTVPDAEARQVCHWIGGSCD